MSASSIAPLTLLLYMGDEFQRNTLIYTLGQICRKKLFAIAS